MSGRALSIAILVCAAIAGAALYYLQVYAFYDRLGPGEVTLRATGPSGEVSDLAAQDLTAIDATSSPIRFRACFRLPEAPVAAVYDRPEPLVAPGWFDCFDAERIGADLETGTARAVLGEANITYGVDRVIALYPDGRAYAWTQINRCGTAVYNSLPPPEGCPPAPPRD